MKHFLSKSKKTSLQVLVAILAVIFNFNVASAQSDVANGTEVLSTAWTSFHDFDGTPFTRTFSCTPGNDTPGNVPFVISTNDPQNNGTRAGEWLQYTLNVTEPGIYTIGLLIAHPEIGPDAPRTFTLNLNGEDIAVDIVAPRATSCGWSGVHAANISRTNVTDINLPAGTHTLRLTFNNDRISFFSFLFTRTGDAIGQPQPSVASPTCNSLTVSWADVPDATSYNVYSVSNAAGDNSMLLQANATSPFVATGLVSGTTHFFRVEATDGTAASMSAVVQGTTATSPIGSPSFGDLTPDYTEIELNFTLPSAATNNRLYFRTSVATAWVLLETNLTGTSYTHENLNENTVYYYRIVSVSYENCLTQGLANVRTLSSIRFPDPMPCAPAVAQCGTPLLVGYVNFAYRGGHNDGRWSINDIDFHGLATETLTPATAVQFLSTGDLTENNRYFIVNNPSTEMGGNDRAVLLGDVPDALGGVFVISGQGNLVYNISGLQRNTRYCVRVVMHNVGRRGTHGGDCDNRGNNVLISTNRTGESGLWTVTNPSGICSPDGNGTTSWGQREVMRRYGDQLVFTGVVYTGAFEDFQLTIRGLSNHQNTINAISSIEVWGCLPRIVDVVDEEGHAGQVFCNNTAFTMTARGGGFGNLEELTWFSGATQTEALASTEVIGEGPVITGRSPRGATLGTSVSNWYVVRGALGFEVIQITSTFCCMAIEGVDNIVFAERFSFAEFETDGCGAGRFARIPNLYNGVWIGSIYRYAGGLDSQGRDGCADWEGRPQYAQNINDSEYAIVRNARDGATQTWWAYRAQHTYPLENPGNDGMLMINAAGATGNPNDFFFRIQLGDLCPETTYEFSAAFASAASQGDTPINFDFRIYVYEGPDPDNYAGGNDNLRLIETMNTGDVRFNDGWRTASIFFTTPPAVEGRPIYILSLVNNGPAGQGNDVLIDDIIVRRCMTTIHTLELETGADNIDVCSIEPVSLEVSLTESDVQLIAGNTASDAHVYIQWMRSLDSADTWEPVGTPTAHSYDDGNNTLIISEFPAAGETWLFRAKISSDEDRAADIWTTNFEPTDCYNDVITEIFTLYFSEELLVSVVASNPFVCAYPSESMPLVTLTGDPTDAEEWFWISSENFDLTDIAEEVWSYDPEALVQEINEDTAGTWYFVARRGRCVSLDSITIVIVQCPVIDTLATPAAVCDGVALTLTQPAITVDPLVPVTSSGWLLGGEAFTPTRVLTMADNGLELVFFAVNACGRTYSNGVTVTVNPLPAPVAGSNSPICVGDDLLLTSTAGENYSWSWTGPNGFTSTEQNPTITAVTTAAAGVYTLVVTNTETGCSTTTTTTVVVNTLPEVTAGSNSPVCVGATLNLTSSGGTSFSWTGPNEFTSEEQNPILTNVTITMAGEYTVEVTDANGCISTANVTIVINPLPEVTIGSNSPVCVGETLNLTSSGGTSFSWEGPGGFTSTDQNPTLADATTAMSGQYIVTVTNTYGCQTTAYIYVTIDPLPVAEIINITGTTELNCDVSEIVVTASGGTSFLWLDNGSTYANRTLTEAGVFTVEVTTENGCMAEASIEIWYVPCPDVVLYELDVFLCADGRNVNAEDMLRGQQLPAGAEWQIETAPNSGQFGALTLPHVPVLADNGRRIRLNLGNNRYSNYVVIRMEDRVLPNALVTGRGDRFLDIFEGYRMVVFNRHGITLHDSTTPWDGTFNGNPVDPGTYYYIIDDRHPCAPIQGTIRVVRE